MWGWEWRRLRVESIGRSFADDESNVGGGRARFVALLSGNNRLVAAIQNPKRNDDADDGMDVDDDDDVGAPAANKGGKKRSVVVNAKGKGGKSGASMSPPLPVSKHSVTYASNPVAILLPGASILSRLGGSTDKKAAPSPGTKILVKNLKFDILEDDVSELFGTVGKVSKAEIVYDRSGRSKGIARVWFERRSDAEKAIKQYDGTYLLSQWEPMCY